MEHGRSQNLTSVSVVRAQGSAPAPLLASTRTPYRWCLRAFASAAPCPEYPLHLPHLLSSCLPIPSNLHKRPLSTEHLCWPGSVYQTGSWQVWGAHKSWYFQGGPDPSASWQRESRRAGGGSCGCLARGQRAGQGGQDQRHQRAWQVDSKSKPGKGEGVSYNGHGGAGFQKPEDRRVQSPAGWRGGPWREPAAEAGRLDRTVACFLFICVPTGCPVWAWAGIFSVRSLCEGPPTLTSDRAWGLASGRLH